MAGLSGGEILSVSSFLSVVAAISRCGAACSRGPLLCGTSSQGAAGGMLRAGRSVSALWGSCGAFLAGGGGELWLHGRDRRKVMKTGREVVGWREV